MLSCHASRPRQRGQADGGRTTDSPRGSLWIHTLRNEPTTRPNRIAADGKNKKEARAAANAAVKLSAEQKQQLAEVQKERRTVFLAALKARNAVLTDEQKAKLKKTGKKKKKKKAA